jgi:hypothetical protein
MATSLWMGAGWQWHGLSHVLRALDAVHVHDGAPEHEAVCEQCLQFASVDGAMPVADSALPQAPAQDSAFLLQGGRVPRIRLHRLRVQSASGTGLIVSGPYRPLSNPSHPCPARSAARPRPLLSCSSVVARLRCHATTDPFRKRLTMNRPIPFSATLIALAIASPPLLAADNTQLQQLQQEIAAMRKDYETQLNALEARLKQAEARLGFPGGARRPIACGTSGTVVCAHGRSGQLATFGWSPSRRPCRGQGLQPGHRPGTGRQLRQLFQGPDAVPHSRLPDGRRDRAGRAGLLARRVGADDVCHHRSLVLRLDERGAGRRQLGLGRGRPSSRPRRCRAAWG